MTHLMNDDISTAYKKILDIKTTKSLALQDIVRKVNQSVRDFKLEPRVKIFILSKLGQLETRLAEGSSENIQLGSLVSVMYQARQLM